MPSCEVCYHKEEVYRHLSVHRRGRRLLVGKVHQMALVEGGGGG